MKKHEDVYTVAILARLPIKPIWWEVREDSDGFVVWFKFGKGEPKRLSGSRGGERRYKHLSTAIADIRSIDPSAMVQLELWSPVV